MGRAPKLTGYEILVRMHIVLGHVGLGPLLATVSKIPDMAKTITKDAIEEFVRRGCGICDTTKLITMAFKSLHDATLPHVGKHWVHDTLKLRVKAFGLGYNYLTSFVCSGSKMKRTWGHADYTQETVIALRDMQRAWVRPTHGEIEAFDCDSHPSHRAEATIEDAQDKQNVSRFSPPYAHQLTGKAEAYFRHSVPAANALLRQCPADGGEEHFSTAFFTYESSHNEVVSLEDKKSNAMRYYGRDHVKLETTMA